MDNNIFEVIKKNLKCSTLSNLGDIKAEIVQFNIPCLYLEIDNSFLYLDELGTTDFLIFEYLEDKEKSFKNNVFGKNETIETFKSLINFKESLYKLLEKDDYYKILYLKVAT